MLEINFPCGCQMNRSRREADETIVQLEDQKRQTSRIQREGEQELDKVCSFSLCSPSVSGVTVYMECNSLEDLMREKNQICRKKLCIHKENRIVSLFELASSS